MNDPSQVFRCRRRTAFRGVALAVALGGFLTTSGTALPALVSRAQDGSTAWAVVREGGAAVTEVWVAGRGEAPRRLRTFPGKPERLFWERVAGRDLMGAAGGGERLCYTDGGLRLPLLVGSASTDGLEAVLTPGGVWAVALDGGEDTPIEEEQAKGERGKGQGKTDSLSLSPLPLTLAGEGGQKAVAAVVEGFSLTRMAYSAAQGGDFKGAASYFRRAGDRFSEMPGEVGLSKAVCRSYAEALYRLSKADAPAVGRWICADHLKTIGVFLKGYAAAQEGRFPESLAALKAWGERRYGASGGGAQGSLSQTFRAPSDANPAVSYGYRAPGAGDAEGTPVAWSLFYPGRVVELVRRGEGFGVVDRALGQAQLDSLLAVGNRLAETDSVAGVAVLEGVTRVAPNWALAFSRLGYACLKTRENERAEAAFQRAINLDRKLAEAHLGMGLVLTQRPKGLYAAIDRFQEALKWDPKLTEARYRIAEARLKMEEYDARREAEKVIDLDPTYAPVYRLMGAWYEDQMEDYEAAALWYTRYLALSPDDREARARLGKVYLKAKDFEKITSLLMDYVQQHPEEVHALPVLAQACLEMRRLDWAQTFFKRYVDRLDASERALYEDVRPVAYPDETTEYLATPEGEREAFLRRFWARRDPNLLTEVNERQLEHYRRVWYARQNFSQGKQPWDRRGEVYIRFGEPDYRSRSNMINLRQSMEVQRIKEKMAREIYGYDASTLTYFGPVFPVRSTRMTLTDAPRLNWDVPDVVERQQTQQQASNALNPVTRETRQGNQQDQNRSSSVGPGSAGSVSENTGRFDTDTQLEAVQQQEDVMQAMRGRVLTPEERVFGSGPDGQFRTDYLPVTAQEDASLVKWESWVYTKVGGGIEITFTDENGHGVFDYAPPPLDAQIPIQRMAKFNQYAPQKVYERTSAVAMDHFTPRNDAPPLQFYYNVADFRGTEDGRSALEVYYGIPRNVGRYLPEQDTTRMVVDRQLAMLNLNTGATYRTQTDLVFQGAGDLTREPGAFVPDVARLEIPPGSYRMEVSARDRLSGRMGVYRQDVEVADYAKGKLRLSSLELAWRVAETDVPDKFTKRGMQVIPLPTRAFRKGQNVFVYYEVYNLRRDASGLTRHVVEYTVRNSTGILSKIARTFVGKRPEVAVSQGQVGTEESEYRYIELDLKGLPPGKSYLTVTVKDTNSGEAVAREMVFTMVE